MSKLRKITTAQDIFTITIESNINLDTYIKTYPSIDPEDDILTQILVYAKDNDWRINQYDIKNELMVQLENHLNEEELLNISDMQSLKSKLDEIANEISYYASNGIEYITIKKFDEEYELDVTSKDIREIFLNMIN